MTFKQIKLGSSVVPHFHVSLTGESISEIIRLFKVIFGVRKTLKLTH